MRGTIQYNLQGNRPIHHRHIIHSTFSAQMMQGRNTDGLFALALIKNKTQLENQNFACCHISEILFLCYQHRSEVLNMLITTLQNQRLHPNPVFSKFTVSDWDKDHADIHYLWIFELPCFGSMIIQGLTGDLVHLDSAPCYSPIIIMNVERSLRPKKIMCLNTFSNLPLVYGSLQVYCVFSIMSTQNLFCFVPH